MADNDTPADDLRSILSKSFDDSLSSTSLSDGVVKPQADDAASNADKATAAAAGDTSTAKTGDDRPRGEDGKFVKTEDADSKAKTEPKDKDEAKAKPEADKTAEADKDKQPDIKATDSKEAPANWSASDKALFKLQSPEAQEFLLRRHKAMEADYTKKVGALTDLKRDYEPVQQLFTPHLDVLKQKGLTPLSVIQRWADVETKLANGGGIDIIAGLVQGYGIDKATLAKRLGFTSSPSGQASTEGNSATPTPAATTSTDDQTALTALEQRIAAMLKPHVAKIDQWEQSQRQAQLSAIQTRESEVETKISSFKSATDKDGNLLHPYFDEVESAMIALAQSYVARKQPLPELADLYDQAVYANPSTRTALLATQKAAQDAKANEEARAKAASARKAASSVTGAPGSGQASRPVRAELSLREQLEEAAAEL